ncbi:TipC family immunity protein [Streptococcus equinus]|uniref:TipC family immunity protein n=1 Tax=Streptococcus equinus TaxID=1335 RepID=UPI00088F5217|nr:TipC family immunity protein [Streptococcus equinus]SDQ14012.1 hypothetical protein SAMN05216407_0417 [Streptococcus equinus]
MTKKLIGILVLLVAALAFGLHHYLSQPKNIFDEMYLEMKGNYLGENDFYKIKDADIKNYKIIDKDMNETDKFEPTISYPNYYLDDYSPNLHLSFDLYQNSKGIHMFFEKYINAKESVVFNVYYSKRERILDKTLRLNLANSDKYIEDQSKVKTYLAKYGITASDLDKYYNEVVNQKVLKDWCSIYDSKFSPKDYGDVTVKTEWENW